MTNSDRPRKYWSDLKNKLKKSGLSNLDIGNLNILRPNEHSMGDLNRSDDFDSSNLKKETLKILKSLIFIVPELDVKTLQRIKTSLKDIID